jgi:phosphoglycerol transferase MdoB-like AlkP superfamily enzyme
LHPPALTPVKKSNVVIIILESFSKEYTGIGHRISYTPFLDSLMKESYVFNHAFANGKRSAEGIPAILAGVPTLMDEPYNSSAYATNTISSLPNLLKPLGYTSSFFHGGTDGTMNFKSFAAIAGFDNYYGRNAYNNENDYDGHWGIWDEPFLQYFAGKLKVMKEPFLASVFTLSSHDPYLVPQKYEGRFPAGTLEIDASVGYSDFALRRFFETIRLEPWFKNTIFVLSPDHTGISGDPFYANNVGQYSIPICFYLPGGLLKGSDSTTVQQTDILPTLLDLLGFDKPFFAFGKNAFDKTQPHFAVNYWGNTYQLYQGNHFLEFNGKTVTGFFDMKNDSLLQNNMCKTPSATQNQMEILLKAYLQTYIQSLVNNKMTLTN